MPTLPDERLAGGLPLLRRRRRRRPPHAHHRPHRRARPRRRRRQPRRASSGLRHDDRTAGVTGAIGRAPTARRRSTSTARAVVNAAGVWSDDVRALDEGTDPDSIRPAKGIHITVPWDEGPQRHRRGRARCRRTSARCSWCRGCQRRRHVQLTYIGTTDTDYDGPLDDPQCTAEDIDYLLEAINLAVDRAARRPDDVVGTWAGLRPLVKARVERTHRRPVAAATRSPRRDSGVVTVTGGKLTTYREMAEDTVDAVRRARSAARPRSARRSRTRQAPPARRERRRPPRRTTTPPGRPLRRRGHASSPP